jgi:hypothetical protein
VPLPCQRASRDKLSLRLKLPDEIDPQRDHFVRAAAARRQRADARWDWRDLAGDTRLDHPRLWSENAHYEAVLPGPDVRLDVLEFKKYVRERMLALVEGSFAEKMVTTRSFCR